MEEKSYFNPCIYSSFLFLTNVCTTAYFGHFIYSLGFYILFLTSILVHSNYNLFTSLLDRIPIIFIVIYGGYLFLQSKKDLILSSLIILTFLSTIYLYFYHIPITENEPLQYKLRSLLHVISSIGHHLIILL